MCGAAGASNGNREVVVLRHEGDASFMSRYEWDSSTKTLSFIITGVTLDKVIVKKPENELLFSVRVEPILGKNQALMKVRLNDESLVKEKRFRLSNYSNHIILLELFPRQKLSLTSKDRIDNLEDLLRKDAEKKKLEKVLARKARQIQLSPPPSQVMKYLRKAYIQLPYNLTIIHQDGRRISTPNGQNALNTLFEEDAVDEIVFIGPKKSIERVKAVLSKQPGQRPAQKEDSVHTSSRLNNTEPIRVNNAVELDEDYPTYSEMLEQESSSSPLRIQLSEIRVSLSAQNGINLYKTLMLLSEISGVSIIIDPYIVDEPTGSRRKTPLEPPGGSSDGNPTGFREGESFQPADLRGPTNTVVGNFNNVPFDLALKIILESHDLDYILFSTPESNFTKPVILVSSKERIEQEIKGANIIDFYQLNYADPQEVYNILDNLGLLPSRTSGWYVYRGRGFGYGFGFGFGFGGGLGRGGGGAGGGGGIGSGGALRFNLIDANVNLTQRQSILLNFNKSLRNEQIIHIAELLRSEPAYDFVSARFNNSRSSEDEEKIYRLLVCII